MKIKIKATLAVVVLLVMVGATAVQAAIQVEPVETAKPQPTLAELQAGLSYWQAQLARLKAGQAWQPMKLESVTGPAKLKAGERGTWWLKAADLPPGAEIIYQTNWGDRPERWLLTTVGREDGQQSIQSFHKFTKTGSYTQHFVIMAPLLAPIEATTTVRVVN